MTYTVCDPIDGWDWIAIDLDGTLADYRGHYDPYTIGDPIPVMAARVQGWRSQGEKLCIYTARISEANDARDLVRVKKAIQDWCMKHLRCQLPITCIKHHGIKAFYDDRAVQVEKNTGRLIGDPVVYAKS